jgi:hypothetical protein
MKDLLSAPTSEAKSAGGSVFSSETLNATISRAAEEWTTQDLLTIVEGLREQRARWNTEQLAGSRKRVTSKQIKPQDEKIQAIKGLRITL